jgi:hypothetical protein
MAIISLEAPLEGEDSGADYSQRGKTHNDVLHRLSPPASMKLHQECQRKMPDNRPSSRDRAS